LRVNAARKLGGIRLPRHTYKYRKPQRRKIRPSSVALALLCLLLLTYPFFEAYHLTVDHHTVLIPSLPASLKNLRIVYASDIRAGARYPQWRVNELVKTINSQSADLVLLGGDYADTSDDAITFFKNLPQIQARLGVLGTVGEADRTPPESNLALLVKAMTGAGVTPLVNGTARIKVGPAYLHISGADDSVGGQPDVQRLAATVRESDCMIFLGHNPDLLTSAIRATGADGDTHWFDLALFGHTHGGQITLLGLPMLPALIPDSGDRYLRGWLEENRASILISNGVGTSWFPARLFAPAQIHVITLKNKETR
jgi:hypothetical protein